jgi:hypothetical protein
MSVDNPVRVPKSWVPVDGQLPDRGDGWDECSVHVLIKAGDHVLEITPEMAGHFRFSTPREVFDVSPEGATSMHRKLGRQGFTLECDIAGDLRWRDKE